MCWDPEMEWMVVYEMLGAAATRQVPAILRRSARWNGRPSADIHGLLYHRENRGRRGIGSVLT
jgi:hypothetical protein